MKRTKGATVQIIHPQKLGKLKLRRLLSGVCQSCGRQFFYRRTGRPKNFCDQKCRQAVRQVVRQTDFRRFWTVASRTDESAQKSKDNSKTFSPDFADRPSVNRRPKRMDRELWRTVVTTEIPERKLTALTAEQIQQLKDPFFQIPDDLSIPPFLKRKPAS
jgi:hypothetical protein